jgi:hypothetical protein
MSEQLYDFFGEILQRYFRPAIDTYPRMGGALVERLLTLTDDVPDRLAQTRCAAITAAPKKLANSGGVGFGPQPPAPSDASGSRAVFCCQPHATAIVVSVLAALVVLGSFVHTANPPLGSDSHTAAVYVASGPIKADEQCYQKLLYRICVGDDGLWRTYPIPALPIPGSPPPPPPAPEGN